MRIGIDVGGTNTDAVLMEGRHVVGWAKLLEGHLEEVVSCSNHDHKKYDFLAVQCGHKTSVLAYRRVCPEPSPFMTYTSVFGVPVVSRSLWNAMSGGTSGAHDGLYWYWTQYCVAPTCSGAESAPVSASTTKTTPARPTTATTRSSMPNPGFLRSAHTRPVDQRQARNRH